MKARKPIAIPNYLRNTVGSPGWFGTKTAARVLEIEAKFWRREGNRDAARALEVAAHALGKIGPDMSPAQAFEWPALSAEGKS